MKIKQNIKEKQDFDFQIEFLRRKDLQKYHRKYRRHHKELRVNQRQPHPIGIFCPNKTATKRRMNLFKTQEKNSIEFFSF